MPRLQTGVKKETTSGSFDVASYMNIVMVLLDWRVVGTV